MGANVQLKQKLSLTSVEIHMNCGCPYKMALPVCEQKKGLQAPFVNDDGKVFFDLDFHAENAVSSLTVPAPTHCRLRLIHNFILSDYAHSEMLPTPTVETQALVLGHIPTPQNCSKMSAFLLNF